MTRSDRQMQSQIEMDNMLREERLNTFILANVLAVLAMAYWYFFVGPYNEALYAMMETM